MRTTDVFPSRFIKAGDIGDNEIVVTVSKVEIEDVGDDRKAVVYFVGKEKGLVCNRTNWDRIALAAGTDETDEWPGVKVQLYTEPVTFNGKTAPAIRVSGEEAVSLAGARPAPDAARHLARGEYGRHHSVLKLRPPGCSRTPGGLLHQEEQDDSIQQRQAA